MANLDTENKRRSATGIHHVYIIPPVPDGTIAALDREQATLIYAGITPQGAVAVVAALFRLYDNFTWIITRTVRGFRQRRVNRQRTFAAKMSSVSGMASRRYGSIKRVSVKRMIPRRSTKRYISKHYTYLFDEAKRKKKTKKG